VAGISLGIDIGGTFTDIVVHGAGPAALTHKELTTPDDPVRGVVAGIEHVRDRHGLDLSSVDRLVHATTLFTNALIERKGAKTGMIATEGFRDMLQIRREHKYELYDIFIEMPDPLVPRRLCLEVKERVAPDGTEETPLDEEGLLTAADKLVAEGCESIGIVFLHAYANPAHEARAAELIAERHPAVFVSTSNEIAAEIREYERASTTVSNAYLQPLAAGYLERLAEAAQGLGIGAPLFLMLSNGGLTHVAEAKRAPVQMLESGPAAGALAGSWFGAQCDARAVLAFDMGGTTAKLAVIEDGAPLIAHHFEAARQKRFTAGSGLPMRISTIELIEIGAGGGSIASIDELGLLKVGPESASADPGPACYGRGGTQPTVTDANLLLGYLDPVSFAGGHIQIHRDAAEQALAALGKQAGLSAVETAWGIHDVVNETMAGAARVHVAERGKDPRSHTLLVTGGGGPLHGSELARKLGVSKLVCPKAAGVASAVGLLMAPARIDRVATVAQRLDRLDWREFEGVYARLEADAGKVIAETGLDPATATMERFADIRYVGQGFELVVPLPAGPYDAASMDAIVAAFERDYLEIFSQTLKDVPMEVINVRVAASAEAAEAPVALSAAGGAAAHPDDARKGSRPVWFPDAGDYVDTPVYDRGALGAGMEVAGPAVVEEPESTLILGADSRFTVDDFGNLIVSIGEARTVSVEGGFDAVTLEVLWRRLITVVDEASAALVRTAFSTVVRESDDFSCVLTDAKGRSIAQATKSVPVFIGSLPATVKAMLDHFPLADIHDGDVLVTNDPWMGTGHLFDINIVKPIFFGGKLVGFSASTAHAPEIGGKLDVHGVLDIFEEGFQIPPMKLYRKGELDESIVALLRANVRAPEQVIGDLFAQITGVRLMENRVQALMTEFGLADLGPLAAEIQGRSEAAMREAIRDLPDGTYRTQLDTDGLKTPVHLEIAVTVDGDSVEIDFAGSSDAVKGAINVAYPYTYAFTAFAVKCIVSPHAPNNEGSFMPVSVKAPKGSILNHEFPLSGGQRVNTGHYLPIAVFGALGQVVPEKVTAGAGSPLWSFLQTGVRDGRPYATKFFFNGATGATCRSDGADVLSWPSNVSCTPVEMMEMLAPFRIHAKRFRDGTGGAGKYRGGNGQELVFECISDSPISITFNADRTRNPAPGLAGGAPGACGEILFNGEWIDTRRQLTLEAGDMLTIRTPAGGGYGDPGERDPADIARDRDAGFS
jgi:5-oxoprolinase (ATP-hydrolysing)